MLEKPICRRVCALACLLFAFGCSHSAYAVHALSLGSTPKYPAGFANFEWVNPECAERRRIAAGAADAQHEFRQVQPVHAEGHRAAGLSSLLFESLLTGTMDEPTTVYGLLAEDIAVAPDKLSVTFTINPLARFHDGKPVHGRGREAQLRHADQQRGGAAVPRGLRRSLESRGGRDRARSASSSSA